MIATEAVVVPPPPKKSKLRIIGFILAFLFVTGGLLFCIWHFGSSKMHQQKKHLLYSSFDESPTHKKLLANLEKSKLSLLTGKKQDGLLNFAEHFANKLAQKGRTLYLQLYSSTNNQVFQLAKDLNAKLLATVGGLKTESDWIVISENGQTIPDQVIVKIQSYYPNSKIVVVTTLKQQKLKGFKTFQYVKLDGKVLGKSIVKSFKVKPQVAEILNDYHDSHEELFNELDSQKFDAQAILGQEFVKFQGLSKEGANLLKQLCKNGQIASKKKQKQPVGLAQYGVIFARNTPLWQNEKNILNYELFFGVNCKNKFASESDLKAYQEQKEKQLEEKRAKEEQAKRKQQAKRIQEQKRLEEEQKKQEELKQKEQQKKSKQATESSKSQKSTKTGANKKSGKGK